MSKVTFVEISPSEFFYRNRDLAGFSNPARALYSASRELIENSLDACETTETLPDVYIRITPAEFDGTEADPRPYRLRLQDNGPGIEAKHVPNAFGRIFFGSKYTLRQSRGMFGMGGKMAILYGQITTNRPVTVKTSTDGAIAYTFDLMIDIQQNVPVVLRRETSAADGFTGTLVETTLLGDYARASSKIQEYLKQTAMVTPYANITFVDPYGGLFLYHHNTTAIPMPPKETLPHPYGMDVEGLRRLLKHTKEATMFNFMRKGFHRVGDRIAKKFLDYAQISIELDPKNMGNDETVKLANALHRYPDFLQPDADCLSPLGEEILKAGIAKELNPEFVTVAGRPPSAYSGFPFVVELALAYGGKTLPQGIKIFRFANRIPLLYDEANDVVWKVVNEEIDWKRYHIPQEAPIAIISHVCSTRIPYKTVGKEYLADRPELERELKNALREALRRLTAYLSRKGSMEMVKRKKNIYALYLPLIARFSTELAQAKRPPHYRKLVEEGELVEGQRTLEEYH